MEILNVINFNNMVSKFSKTFDDIFVNFNKRQRFETHKQRIKKLSYSVYNPRESTCILLRIPNKHGHGGYGNFGEELP